MIQSVEGRTFSGLTLYSSVANLSASLCRRRRWCYIKQSLLHSVILVFLYSYTNEHWGMCLDSLARNLGCQGGPGNTILQVFFIAFGLFLSLLFWMWLSCRENGHADHFLFLHSVPPMWVIRKHSWLNYCLCVSFSSCSLLFGCSLFFFFLFILVFSFAWMPRESPVILVPSTPVILIISSDAFTPVHLNSHLLYTSLNAYFRSLQQQQQKKVFKKKKKKGSCHLWLLLQGTCLQTAFIYRCMQWFGHWQQAIEHYGLKQLNSNAT